MLKNSFFKTIPFLLFVVLFNSCDKEFNVVGEDLIGENSFDIKKDTFSVKAYNQKLGPIQSNNLEVNQLGIYNNPSFGTTTANFVTQVTLATVNPTIDKVTVKIKSAVLTIPYFYDKTKTVVKTDGSSTYVLDSIYGSPLNAKMKLSVYESNYFMADLDPLEQLTQPQKFYTDQYSEFFAQKKPQLLNDSTNKAENIEFFFDAAEHSVTTTGTNPVTTKSPPRMELNLNNNFFLDKILKAPDGSLADNTTFKNYFRGLFFNIEAIDGTQGNMAMLNFKAGKITITYTETVDSKDVEKTLVLNLSGNTASLLNQSNTNVKYANATIVDEAADTNLYLKGGEGSLSVLELFGPDEHGDKDTNGPNDVPDELDEIRKNKYLINEADLIFYLNSAEMGASYIPQRLYLYDYTNNKVLVDYNESTVVSSNTKYNKYVFGGILGKDKDGAYFYKFRITGHVRNLVNSTEYDNVKLGLVVTEDVNKSAFYALKDKTGIPLYAPLASVMNPLGAIVFGNNIPSDNANYAKRLKFEIYYTKPN